MKIVENYNLMLVKKRDEYRKKNPKTDNKYRASSSGMYARKIYFESIEKAETTEPIDPKSLRIMRLGEIVHKDMQETLKESLENN